MKNIARTIAFIFLLSSCTENQKSREIESNKDQFISYITAYTSGIISARSKIVVRLASSQDEIKDGQEAINQLFEFTPKIAGKAYWENNQTVVFEPTGSLPQGETYKATFLINDLIPESKEKGNFKFSFKVLPQNFDLTVTGMAVLKNENPNTVTIKGYVETADYANQINTEGMVTAVQDGNELPIVWEHSQDAKTHNFTIEKVQRGENQSVVDIAWGGQAIGVDKKGNLVYTIPGLNDYSVVATRVVTGQKNYISVMFSNPIDEKQDLNGFISLADEQPKYVISGNELKLYSQGAIFGEVQLTIFKQIKSKAGKVLSEDYQSKLQMPNAKPEVRLIGNNGTILPNSQGLILPFEAIGLKAVDISVIQIFEGNVLQYLQVNSMGDNYQLNRVGRSVGRKTITLLDADVTNLNKWTRFTLNLEDIINIESGALYQVDINFRKHQALFFCGGDELVEDWDNAADYDWDNQEESSNWDWYEDNYYDGYDWDERENPCHETYYRQHRNVSQVVLASDLGLIAKKSDQGSIHVFTTNLLDTKPMAGVELKVFDFQQQVVGKGRTDADGMAKIEVGGKPFVLVANAGNQYGYLKIDDGSSLSLSNFNVTGKKIQKGIKGYIYGERGVWRPGDNIYLTFILEDKGDRLPKNYPVVLELKNPQGQLVQKVVKTESASGMFAFDIKTEQEAPTGRWQVVVKAGGAQFYKDLKIESVKPNRLKIELDFKKDRLTALDDAIEGDLNVRWLHGAIAKGLKAEYELILSPVKTTFDDYPNFSFDDQSKNFYAERQMVFSGNLDQNGYARINLDMYVEDNPPGALNAIFVGKVFEEGGNFSIDQLTIPYYPYRSFMGLKAPEGDKRGMLLTDEDHNISIVSVDAAGKPVSRKNIAIELYKLNWRWWWDNSYDDVSNYVGRSYHTPIQKSSINTANGKGSWKLNIKYPEWGRYYVKVTDPVSGHSAGQVVFVDWPGWAGKGKRGDAGGVSMLNFEVEKEAYQVGEEVKLTLPSSAGGRILVSLETGRKVVKTFWVETKDKSTVVPFTVTKEMSPNVYANITLLQPHAQTANDLPIRMYGVQSIKVVDPTTTLNPKLSMPPQLSPEQKFTVQVSEENDRPMAYTLAMVDDGLLDLTRFKTPNPWSNFYSKEALGIKTWDVYDDVLGAYGGEIERLLAIGGDGELEEGPKAKKANRFKPVVKYLGPFSLEAGKTATHEIQMPQYVGSVRVMLVAAKDGAYGAAAQTTPVKQSVMALATMPRVAGPGEEMSLPVTVFVSEDDIKQVKVTVAVEGKLKIAGKATQSVKFSAAGEKVIYFKVKASEALGIGKVSVQAEGGGTTAKYEIEMEVRASNPEMVDVEDKLVGSSEVWATTYLPLGMLGTNEATIELSSLPPLNLEQRLRYLIRYPHGCIEQTTSAVFAQLYLEEMVSLSAERKQQITTNIQQAIQRIRSFQTSNGGFTYWPGQVEENDWGTNYAGHFLLEAQKKGYAVPEGLLNNWKRYQKKQANQWSKGGKRNNDLAQAYRLYTLVLAGEKKMGAMNRMKEMEEVSVSAKWRLALAYAVAGYKVPAETMIDGLSKEVKTTSQMSYTYGSATRDRAMILETLSYLDRREEAYPVLQEIAKVMGNKNRWMSTQSTAYSLIGIVAYTKGQSTAKAMDFDVNIGSTVANYEVGGYVTQLKIDDTEKEVPLKISNNGDLPIFARIIRSGIPLTGQETEGSKNVTMKVKYIDRNGQSIRVDDIKQGTDFIAIVSVSHPGIRGKYEELALTQIFPSGWEIINTRLNETDGQDQGDQPDYLDIRDDRAMMYFDLKMNERKTFQIRLNAAYKGKFYLPAVAVEAMYDDTIYARNTGKWVTVSE